MLKITKKNRVRRRRVMDIPSLLVIIAFILFMITTTVNALKSTIPIKGSMSFEDFTNNVKNNNIDYVVYIKDKDIMTVYVDDTPYTVVNAKYDEFRKDLLEQGVEIRVRNSDALTAFSNMLAAVPMLLLMSILAYYVASNIATAKKGSFQVLKNGTSVTFEDVAGMTNIKKEVQFAVDILVNSKEIKEAGARPTKGIIFDGPPGTGKTLIAKAIAGEAKVPFICASGSDFDEMFVGLGASRIRSLWRLAELNAPCVLFIDEIDAVGGDRARRGSEYYKQTLNALLTKLDGLSETTGILVIGATNRPEMLDPALTRSGRFDKKIHIGLPDTKADRRDIVRVHLKNKKTGADFDIDKVTAMVFGMSGADIANVLNEAVLCSVSDSRHGVISMSDIESATTKLMTSGVLKSNVTEEEKHIAAIHEAGHILANKLFGNTVVKASIQAYSSGVGGITLRDGDDNDDMAYATKTRLTQEIKILLAGGIAERKLIGEASYGWRSDLTQVSNIAINMYTKYGMLGNYIDRPVETLKESDYEKINTFIHNTYNDMLGLMGKEENIKVLNRLAGMLEQEESIYKESIDSIFEQTQ